jgi:ribosome-associated protein
LLRFAQVKKTKSPTRSGGQGRKTSAPGKGRDGGRAARAGKAGKSATSGQTRKPGRIPVRGSGVSDRRALARPLRAPRADLDETRALALAAIDAALDKKALAPVLIDVSGMASYTDFIAIVSGRSDRQVDAIAENIRQVMKARGRMTLGQEGTGNGRWTLLDFGGVVVHVFYHPVREFYDLESLWIEAPRIPLDVPADATISEPESYYGAL